jgi:transcriptional regulator with XRE-family HTH domain
MPPERSSGVGATLRDARERRGVNLHEIAARTRISVRVLEALERNDISRLPGGIFSRAFVRAYAAEVGLDPEQVLARVRPWLPDGELAAADAAPSKAPDGPVARPFLHTVMSFLQPRDAAGGTRSRAPAPDARPAQEPITAP